MTRLILTTTGSKRKRSPSIAVFRRRSKKSRGRNLGSTNGGLGAFVNLDGAGGTNDGYVCEIPPGKQLREQKHLYEEMVYILEGHGATSIWQKDGKKHTFEWHPGSLFAIPLNAHYQHFNGQG